MIALPNRKGTQMSTRFSHDVSDAIRSAFNNSFYSWSNARKGDFWLNPATQEKKEIVSNVRVVDPAYDAIWYELTFVDGTGARCANNMGFGTILVA